MPGVPAVLLSQHFLLKCYPSIPSLPFSPRETTLFYQPVSSILEYLLTYLKPFKWASFLVLKKKKTDPVQDKVNLASDGLVHLEGGRQGKRQHKIRGLTEAQ